ncbi:zinc finger protein 729-like [Anneissia japonica]|uniref:zinc finger protein 729-like n=1 Tax=Anneissia japonica TaxID=1529436 RepID=UPI001425B469|nr:zinc finger protein 729-like [Anneissia japonica]
MKYIKDKNFVKGIYNRARRTLPHGLTIEPAETHATRTGVWAQTNFAKDIIFGPYQGPGENSAEEWKEFQSSKTSEDLDNNFNERMCNWMIFVNLARNSRESNLEPVLYNGAIFFRTSKLINKINQLLVSGDVEVVGTLEDSDVRIPGLPISQEGSGPIDYSLLEQSIGCKISKPVPTSNTDILAKQSAVNEDDELSFDLNEYLQQNQLELIEKPVNYNPHNRTEPVCYRGTCQPGKTIRGNEPYMCKQCGARFAHVSVLMKHENTHMEDLGRYRCTYCGRVFVQKGSLLKHEEIHTMNQKLSICKVCSVCFERQSDLDEHFKVFHSSEVGRAFPCFICGTGFTKIGSLRAHIRLKHPGKLSQKCRFCMKTFKSKAFLDSHEYQHLSDKPFACQFCSFKFSASSKLLNHIKCTHKEEVESTAMAERESLICYYCGYTFSVHTQFIKHVKLCKAGLQKDSASPLSSVAGKQLRCMECTTTFLTNVSLQNHMKRQHGDRPYKCHYCLRCFKFNCNLKNHILMHMKKGLSPKFSPAVQDSVMTWNNKNANHVYFCNTCNSSFQDRNFYQKHQCRKDTSQAKSILVCPVCRRGFYGKSQHTRHVALCKTGSRNKSMAYRMKKLPVYCQYCKVAFGYRKELYAHERVCCAFSEKSNKMLERYGCAICNKAFLKCSLLKVHLRKLHPDEYIDCRIKELKLNMCNGCKKCFRCLKGLSKHVNHCPIALGKTSRSLSCKLCYKTFKTILLFNGHKVSCELKNHSEKVNVNQGTGIMKGAQIAKEANGSKGVSMPVLTSSFSCEHCGKVFLNGQGLGKHKKYCQIPEEPKSYVSHKCSKCSRFFLNRNMLIAHKMVCVERKRKTKAKQKSKRFPCTDCGKSFRWIQSLQRHKRSCMPDIISGADTYISGSVNPESSDSSNEIFCKVCGRTFKKIQGLATHELTCMPNIAEDRYPPTESSAVSSTTKSRFKCKYCYIPFNKYKALIPHLKNCSSRILQINNKQLMAKNEAIKNESERITTNNSVTLSSDLYICRKCGTSFQDEGKLVEHDFVCCPEFKVFGCSKCSATFSNETDLARHAQMAHNRIKNFMCKTCGKTFLNNAGLGKHKNTHKTNVFLRTTKQQNSNIAKKCIKCKVCGCSFGSLKGLRKHKNLNRCKVIYHNCTLCGTNFKSITEFENHSGACTEARQHICKICGRGFRVPGYLDRHVLKEHDKSFNTSATRHRNNEQQNAKEKLKQLKESESALRKPNISSAVTGSHDHSKQRNDSFKCGFCSKRFPTLEAFADHEDAEHSKKFKCHVCSQSFKFERQLLHHRRCHVNVYPHKCKMCPMRYKYKAHLKRHFENKHSYRSQHLKKELRSIKKDGY